MNISAALAGFGTGAGLIIAIGAQNAFVLRQGLRREYVGLVVLTCIFGDVLCITLGVAGMGAAVKAHPLVLEIFRWGGAAFLAYYGCLALNRARKGGEALGVPGKDGENVVTPGRVLAACLAFTFLNPHVYLDTVVMLGSISTQFAGADRWSSRSAPTARAPCGLRLWATAQSVCSPSSESPAHGSSWTSSSQS